MKIITLLIMLFSSLATLTTETPNETTTEQYPTTGIVTEIYYDTDQVVIMDFNGFLYTFYGVEDWMIGDVCSCIMDDNGTPDVKDDIIVQTKYSGYDYIYYE